MDFEPPFFLPFGLSKMVSAILATQELYTINLIYLKYLEYVYASLHFATFISVCRNGKKLFCDKSHLWGSAKLYH